MTRYSTDNQTDGENRLATLRRLADSWDFSWAFMRELDVVRNDLESGEDIDIWAEQKAMGQLTAQLLANGWYLAGGRCLGRLGDDRYNAILRFRNDDPSWPTIEVFFGALRWRPFIYWKETRIARDICSIDGIPFLSGATLLAILLNRIVIRDEFAGERYNRAREHFHSLGERDIVDWEKYTAQVFGASCTTYLKEKLEQGGVRKVGRIQFTMQLILRMPWKLQVCKTIVRNCYYWFRRMVIAGVSCELVGTDGTGKSTLSTDVSVLLQEYGCDTHEIYWGRTRGNTKVVDKLRNLVLAKTPRPADTENKPDDNTRKSSTIYKLITSIGGLVFLVEYWFRYLSRIYPPLRTRKVYLLDRGPTDFAVMKHTFGLTRQLYRYGPPITVRIFTTAPSEIIYQRKQERALPEIEFQQAAYFQIYATGQGKKVAVCIDTTRKRPDNAQRVAALLLSTIHAQQGLLDRSLLLVAADAVSAENSD